LQQLPDIYRIYFKSYRMQHQCFLFVKNTAFLLLLVLFSCSSDSDDEPTPEFFNKMDDCRTMGITDSATIYQHLIAEWDLVGFACGFCQDPDLPFGNTIFEEGFGVIHYQGANDDSIMTTNFTWRLEKPVNPLESTSAYKLVTDPFHPALNSEIFCPKYMFYNDTPVDGAAYLFEKK
jgi:hypothetical protein